MPIKTNAQSRALDSSLTHRSSVSKKPSRMIFAKLQSGSSASRKAWCAGFSKPSPWQSQTSCYLTFGVHSLFDERLSAQLVRRGPTGRPEKPATVTSAKCKLTRSVNRLYEATIPFPYGVGEIDFLLLIALQYALWLVIVVSSSSSSGSVGSRP